MSKSVVLSITPPPTESQHTTIVDSSHASCSYSTAENSNNERELVKIDDTNICQHIHIEDGVCVNCQIVIKHQIKILVKNGKHVPTIEADLEKLSISYTVKHTAMGIHSIIMKNQNYPIYRDPNRTKLIFFCLYQALQKIGDKPSPYVVADMLGMQKKNISNALSMCGQVQTGYVKTIIFATPGDRLPDICRRMNLSDESVNEMTIMCKQVCDNLMEIDNEKPSQVAGIIVLYYMTINGISYDEEIFCQLLNIKKVKCLDKLYDRILKVL